MKMIVVSVRDRAAVSFGRPIFAHATGQAIRSFQDEINRVDADNPMSRHPEDYDLYELGSFDDQTGQFENQGPRQIAVGKDMVKGA